mgnify:CR=1 FL=1
MKTRLIGMVIDSKNHRFIAVISTLANDGVQIDEGECHFRVAPKVINKALSVRVEKRSVLRKLGRFWTGDEKALRSGSLWVEDSLVSPLLWE